MNSMTKEKIDQTPLFERRNTTTSAYHAFGLLKGFDEFMETNELIQNPLELQNNAPTTLQEVHRMVVNPSSQALERAAAARAETIKNQFKNEPTLFFRDARRRIDMILAFEDDGDEKKREKREVFNKNIIDEGLETEVEDMNDSVDRKTYFLKLHAPWDVLTRYAEMMNMKKPIKDKEPEFRATKAKWFANMKNPFELRNGRLPEEPSFFMATFNRDKENLFIIKDRENFFSPAQRSAIVWQILLRTRYGEERIKVGIRRLLSTKVYTAAFPLHEGQYEKDDSVGVPNDRRLLYSEWAHFSRCLKHQPLWLVRRYFGDKIGLYFAWLGFYTKMLIPASAVGVMCFLLGLISMEGDYYTPGREICNATGPGNITMCPLCDKVCKYWKLKDSCLFFQLTYPFDNPSTVFFAIFMAFWATTFLELWKRRQAVISWEWDLSNYENEEEPRPEFEAAVKTSRINPVTQAPEPYLPVWNKMVRVFAVSSMVLFMLFIVIAVVVGVIVYRLSMLSLFYTTEDQLLRKYAKLITSITAACINLAMIVILHSVYYKLAIWLTNIEFPRTKTEYEDSFTFKMFLFQFVNYYAALIYIAFFKGRFYRHPGDKDARSNKFEQIRVDLCDVAGCLSELFIQLSIVMIGKQFLNNIVEILVPKIYNYCHQVKSKKAIGKDGREKTVPVSRWEQDYHLKEMGELGLFDEYLEMVIQYGFVTLFVAAFPLAPFFALLNNIIEIRLDAYKMVTQLRRPLAERVEDIGAWYGILQGITYTAVVTNAFVIGYTSDFVPKMVYKFVYSDNHDLVGYVMSSLSVFNTSDYEEDMKPIPDEDDERPLTCMYRGYRNHPGTKDEYEFSDQYWHVFAARLSLVVVFEHLVFLLTGIMAFAIPDVPEEIKTQIQREKLLAKEALFETEIAKMRQERLQAALTGQLTAGGEDVPLDGTLRRPFTSSFNDTLRSRLGTALTLSGRNKVAPQMLPEIPRE